jgi:hypothetical protein
VCTAILKYGTAGRRISESDLPRPDYRIMI